jgi:RecB family exonuclease
MKENTYSKSKIDTFKKCKLQYKLKYIDKIKLPQPHSDDLQFGGWIHKVLEDYDPDKNNLKEVVKYQRDYDIRGRDYKKAMPETFKNAVEFTKKFWKYPRQAEERITYKDDSVNINGIVDLRMEQGDYLLVVDYKSSKSPNAQRHEYQMKMYAFMLSKIHDIPAEKIRCMIYYPRIDAYDRYQFSSGELKEFERELIGDIAKIELTTDSFPAEPGYHCRWCPYLDTGYCSKGQMP